MRWIVLSIVVVLAGCATPPGKLTSSDMSNYSRSVDATYQQTYDGLREYARQCGDILGHIPEWYEKSGKTIIDLYLRMGLGGRSNDAFGIIEISPKGNRTEFSMGVVKAYSNPVFRSSNWWRPKIDKILDGIERGSPASCQD